MAWHAEPSTWHLSRPLHPVVDVEAVDGACAALLRVWLQWVRGRTGEAVGKPVEAVGTLEQVEEWLRRQGVRLSAAGVYQRHREPVYLEPTGDLAEGAFPTLQLA